MEPTWAGLSAPLATKQETLECQGDWGSCHLSPSPCTDRQLKWGTVVKGIHVIEVAMDLWTAVAQLYLVPSLILMGVENLWSYYVRKQACGESTQPKSFKSLSPKGYRCTRGGLLLLCTALVVVWTKKRPHFLFLLWTPPYLQTNM